MAEGLEDALNVDRDSFNQFHPQYKELQQIVHGHLAELFKTMYGKIQERSEEREKGRSIERRMSFERTLAKASGKSISVSMSTLPATRVHVSSGKVSIQLAKPQALRTKRAYQELASAILALFDVVMEQSSRDDVRRELFTDYLLKVLAKW